MLEGARLSLSMTIYTAHNA